ncbi:1-acylglycerol-3-phosphate O-acyltransferase [Gracilaria domingensis]|nr:1-acylglycerol-3-phosphate O-acyltransferase [Gracilaria domingensis]
MSAAFWYRNFDHLVAAGYSVWAVDLLGWGRSALAVGGAGRAATQLLHAGGTQSGRLPVRRVHQAEPQARRPPRAAVAGRRAASRTAAPRALLLAAAAEHCTTRRPARFSALCAQVSTPPHTPPSGETAIRPIIRFRGLRRAECARPIVEFLTVFDTPVRIVCGSHDSSIRVHDVFALYDRMKRMGFCVKMDVLEQCDHCPMLEQPDQFSAIMNSVMKSTRSSAF